VNIEDLLKLVKEEWLWAGVAAISALAAIVGALLPWITAAVIKRRERPEADWAITVTPRAGSAACSAIQAASYSFEVYLVGTSACRRIRVSVWVMGTGPDLHVWFVAFHDDSQRTFLFSS
jgi:hypothetical protein